MSAVILHRQSCTDTDGIGSSAANAALAAEQERHRHAKEELNKARNALQFVKTQVLVCHFLLYWYIPSEPLMAKSNG